MGTALFDALAGKKTVRPPFWFMRQAGRYLPEYRKLREKAGSFLNLCYTPEWAAEVTLQPIRRFGMDAAILFSDILVVPHSLGCELNFVEGEGPKLSPVRNVEAIAALSPSRVEQHIQPVLETVRRVRSELAKDKALIGFAGAPWTVACYMVEGGGSREFAQARKWAAKEPVNFSRLLEIITNATAEYLIAQVNAGADALMLFDSWAGILPAEDFLRWCVAPTQVLVEKLRATCPGIPIIGFPRAASPWVKNYAENTKVNGLGIDYALPVEWARDEISPLCTLQGNLDPLLLAHDVKGAISEAGRLRNEMRDCPFIFNLGHGMIPETPVENVQKLCDFLKEQ